MQFVPTEAVLKQGQEAHFKGNLDEAEKLYHSVFNQALGDPNCLYLLGTLYMNKDYLGLAANLLQQCVTQVPNSAEAWNNYGCVHKRLFHKDQALRCFQNARNIQPDNCDIISNAAGVWVNEGEPDRCLSYCAQALAINAGHVQSLWHKGLALLELQDWANAWQYHEMRLDPESGCNTAIRNYADDGGMTPWWDGKTDGLIAVPGEQGLGDECMFASVLPEVLAAHPKSKFVIECSPRLHGLFERSFAGPNCEVHGTHELDGSEWKDGRTVDYKCHLGTLPKWHRHSEADFPGTPYLVADPHRRRQWRKQLRALGDKPKVGIGWQGGAWTTRVDLRTIMLPIMAPLLEHDVDWIALQYTASAPVEIADFRKSHGVDIHYWKKGAKGKDLDDQAALIAELDLVITVCQTAVHVAGGLGTETWCLTPSRPAWRYGVTGNMPWYNSVDLIRQGRDEDWMPAVNRAAQRLGEWLDRRAAA